MTSNSTPAASPILIVPYVWIGDFVRCHSVVKLLRSDAPERPVDMVSSTLCAPLADYMPGIRQAIVIDLPRRRLGVALQQQLARRLREKNYGQALVMSRKWKAALAPWLAGIPLRTGFAGEFRFGLLNDVRWGERKLPRMIDQMGALAMAKGATLPAEWPLPELKVPADEVARWRERRGLAGETRPIVTLSPGAVGGPPESGGPAPWGAVGGCSSAGGGVVVSGGSGAACRGDRPVSGGSWGVWAIRIMIERRSEAGGASAATDPSSAAVCRKPISSAEQDSQVSKWDCASSASSSGRACSA